MADEDGWIAGSADAEALICDLARARSLRRLREVASRAARNLLQADGVTFVLREGDLCFYAEEDAIAPLWKGRRFPISACISGWAMREKQCVAIEDIYSDSRIPHDAYRSTFVRSVAMVPLQQDDSIAAMGAYWSENRAVSEAELRTLRCIANVAGLTISNIELKKSKQHLQAQEEAQQLLVSELRHRFRNHLNMIMAIFRQTRRSTHSVKELEHAFFGRVQALARAQELLPSSAGAGLDLRTILREQLAAISGGPRVAYRGPDVILQPDDALHLGLMVYELSTNACKHGALSSDTGRVRLEWTVETGEGARRLELCWREENGPPVTPPQATGFGSQLVGQALQGKGGNAEIRYEPTGVVCHIRLPLP